MKSIFTALAPNIEPDDAWLALKLLFSSWRWKRGPELGQLADAMSNRLDIRDVMLFETGRTGLEAILTCSGIGSDDEVALQAFTCVAVPNAVLWAGATPVYVDCNDQYTMDVEDLKKKISPQCKAIIVQHTFGTMADFDAINAIARERNLLVIEDCAHSFAMRGDLGFFSFGGDKVISSVFGGAVAVGDRQLAEKIRTYHASLPQAGWWWILCQLKYTVDIWLARVTFDIGIGKLLLALTHVYRNKPVTAAEKNSRKSRWLGRQMPNALAALALHQLAKLDRFEAHRKKIIAIYRDAGLRGSGILRFTLCVVRPQEIRDAARQQGIFLGDWYTTAIAPVGVSYDAIGYDPSTCPVAERLTTQVINLPTHINITEHDAQRIATFISTN